MKKILAISGSTKSQSSNLALLQFLKEKYRKVFDIEIYSNIDQLPHFNPDLDQEPVPTEVENLRLKIEMADGVIICTPEYVFSLPGSLKNAIEWMVSTTLFSNKPLGLIVAAASGEKAFESLLLIMRTLEADLSDSSNVLIKSIKGKLNEKREVIDSKTLVDLDQLVSILDKKTSN